jgi:hypothetical protein
MLRWIGSLLLVSCSLAAVVEAAQTADSKLRQQYPRRFARGSYTQYVPHVRRGEPVVSKAYNGYRQGYPAPAFLYYGYPHSGDGTGIGPLTPRK